MLPIAYKFENWLSRDGCLASLKSLSQNEIARIIDSHFLYINHKVELQRIFLVALLSNNKIVFDDMLKKGVNGFEPHSRSTRYNNIDFHDLVVYAETALSSRAKILAGNALLNVLFNKAKINDLRVEKKVLCQHPKALWLILSTIPQETTMRTVNGNIVTLGNHLEIQSRMREVFSLDLRDILTKISFQSLTKLQRRFDDLMIKPPKFITVPDFAKTILSGLRALCLHRQTQNLKSKNKKKSTANMQGSSASKALSKIVRPMSRI